MGSDRLRAEDDPHQPGEERHGLTHYLGNSEWRALRRLHRENPPGPHVFGSERGGTATTACFRTMMARHGDRAKMPLTRAPLSLRDTIAVPHHAPRVEARARVTC